MEEQGDQWKVVFTLLVKDSLRSLNSETNYLQFEVWKPVFVKRDMAVYIIDL